MNYEKLWKELSAFVELEIKKHGLSETISFDILCTVMRSMKLEAENDNKTAE